MKYCLHFVPKRCSVSDRGWRTSLIKLAQHKHITMSEGCNLTGQLLSLFFKYY